ncbi:TIGR04282 family arsenosugar biosynthesis glycosyltransferase [Nocardia otitidiscaviarum]|uniref:TIGR04282 family arsenosugar biosynthesis glycosyltransferase n=1 Tax=Nocardia otitidiscaviarum TaxID=1823 RepID=UPI0024539BC9|nr:DUF2064 domain-containing protein [Nocardia otitidiscaviarum]
MTPQQDPMSAPFTERLPATLLVVAKAPIAGFAKTRLTPPLTPHEGARLAAAALLDTLDAMRAAAVRHRVVAWTGDLAAAEAADDIGRALADFTVVPQRGHGFAERLAHAHADAARFGLPIVQIGMDTPQVTPELLTGAAARLTGPADAVFGPAAAGGWWALGWTDPWAAPALAEVPMSTARTGALTRDLLHRSHYRVHDLPVLNDVDTYADALQVAADAHGRFGTAMRRHRAAHPELVP